MKTPGKTEKPIRANFWRKPSRGNPNSQTLHPSISVYLMFPRKLFMDVVHLHLYKRCCYW